MRRLLAGFVLACTTMSLAAPAGAARLLTEPGAPTVSAFSGVDGVLLTWTASADQGGDAAAPSFVVQRSAAPDGEFADLAEVPAGTSRYTDATAAAEETWSYRVVQVNAGGRSPGSAALTRSVPAPVEAGAVSALALDGGDLWPGGVFFDGAADTLAVTAASPYALSIQASSAAGSPQGARTARYTIGTVAGGARLQAGATYATTVVGTPDGAPALTWAGQPCAKGAGSLAVQEASFKADGTPLVFAATFTDPCGAAVGALRWKAHAPVANAMTTDKDYQDFAQSPVGKVGAPVRTVTLRNAGTTDQPLSNARIEGRANLGAASSAGEFAVASDGCSGTVLAPGATCTIGIAPSPTATGNRYARLLIDDATAVGHREVGLSVSGIDVPPAPVVKAHPTLRAVELQWTRPAGTPATSGYTVYRGTSAEDLTKLADVGATPGAATVTASTPGSYSDRSAQLGTTYFYAVTAKNSVGEGARSAAVSATPAATGLVVVGNAWRAGRTDVASLGADGFATRLTLNSADNDTPAVTPDGTTVVYASNVGRTSTAPWDFDLWVLPLGGTLRRLTSDAESADGDPAVSPDGKTVAFTRYEFRPGSQGELVRTSVYTVPLAGGTPTFVPGTVNDGLPTWSPSGRLLATSTAGAGGKSVIAVTSLDGAYRYVLPGSVDPTWNAFSPSWSPDGRSLAYLAYVSETRTVLRIRGLDGEIVRTTDFADANGVRWAPAGDRVLVEGVRTGTPGWVWSVPVDPRTDPVAVANATGGRIGGAVAVEPAAPYAPTAVPALSGVTGTLFSGGARLGWAALARPGEGCAACAQAVVVRVGEAGAPPPAGPVDGVGVRPDDTGVNLTGLTNGSTYGVSLFTLNGYGDLAAPVSVTVQPGATPAVAPDGSVLTAFVGDGPNFTATWGPALPAGQKYEVQVGTRVYDAKTKKYGAVAWKPLSNGAATKTTVTATAGTTYHLRARVSDAEGHATAWSPTSVVPVPYDAAAFTASGTWSALTKQKGRFLGTLRTASKAGAALSLTAQGSAFTLLADLCPTCGAVKVYVDGKLVRTVDTYAASTRARQKVWSTSLSGIGSHTIKLVVVGTTKRPAVKIDGLIATR